MPSPKAIKATQIIALVVVVVIAAFAWNRFLRPTAPTADSETQAKADEINRVQAENEDPMLEPPADYVEPEPPSRGAQSVSGP